MKLIVTHKHSYFLVYHVWAKENATFTWPHTDDDGVGTGQASYYKGRLKTTDASNPLVIGQAWQGPYEWSAKGTYPEHWTKKNEWQKCTVVDGDIEWWCLHSNDDRPLSVKYLPVFGRRSVAPGTSVLVLDGRITSNDRGVPLSARSMHHIRPRPHAMIIEGDAKIWLIKPLSQSLRENP